ncbi:aminomethyl transferase family protein [Oricola sp.]|uniref:aminomethyl transferase family protein n=1 Tax=Oricola sp. TaxID=1979950 RepID=UPI0025F6D509|nr:aminomethyl transferase family protein [Oricola sp.]MCI5076163.1 aminomethyl transferase family protein [Oricola sp.]
MTYTSLEDRIQRQGGDALDLMRNAQTGRYQFPVPPEFTTWMEEQRAWRESAALMDQSFHMTDLYVSGPDTMRLLSDLAVNSFAKFGRDKAKQLVCCNHEGYVIGDAIVFGLEEDAVNIVGRPVVPNWVQYHAETGGYDVTVERDERKLDNPDKPRKTYRYEVQGPNALKILEKVNEGGPLTTKFFNMGEITIAGCKARTLTHGMGGEQGLEMWGPFEDGAKVKAALLEAGAEFGLRQVGARAYSTAAAESGWVPSPLPAIFSGEGMKAYREWLPANSFEAISSLGGSLDAETVEAYYLTPWDLDYGRVVKFDHDFIGRAALEAMAEGSHRKKMTLVWNADDVLAVFGGMMDGSDLPAKYMEMPAAHYATHPYDRVLVDGRDVGVSISPVFSANERAWISLAILEEAAAAPGGEVTVVWGEPNGGTAKPNVEPHRQMQVRAEVHPWPIHESSRQHYRAQT